MGTMLDLRKVVRRSGVTLVELLIAVLILALLGQLLFPAVEMSRESARITACNNNLRQIGLASQVFTEAQGFMPSGGWHPWAVGDPLRGYGKDQPGGWIYGLLPYLESAAIHDLPNDGDPDRVTALQRSSAAGMLRIPLQIMHCPSRRLPRAYPYWLPEPWDVFNSDFQERVARADYAASGGSDANPDFKYFTITHAIDRDSYNSMSKAVEWAPTDRMNGVVYMRSETAMKQITDGLTNTLFAGEKHIEVQYYKNGGDPGDNHSMYQGFDRDIVRWTDPRFAPSRDDETPADSLNFGSAHPSAFNVVYCGGQVESVVYDIDPVVLKLLGDRSDGQSE